MTDDSVRLANNKPFIVVCFCVTIFLGLFYLLCSLVLVYDNSVTRDEARAEGNRADALCGSTSIDLEFASF